MKERISPSLCCIEQILFVPVMLRWRMQRGSAQALPNPICVWVVHLSVNLGSTFSSSESVLFASDIMISTFFLVRRQDNHGPVNVLRCGCCGSGRGRCWRCCLFRGVTTRSAFAVLCSLGECVRNTLLGGLFRWFLYSTRSLI